MKRLALALVFSALLACACGSVDVPPAPTTGPAGQCATCHMGDFASARNHEGVKPTTCATCHTQNGWHPTRVQHTWPLTGAHAGASCFGCHHGVPPVFLGTPAECYGCHRADYEKAPRHVAGNFATTCEQCHTTTAWKEERPREPATREAPSVTTRLPTAPSSPTATPKPRPTSVAPRPTYTSPPPVYTSPPPVYTSPAPAPKPTYTPPAPAPKPTYTPKPDVTSAASQHR